MYRPDVWEKCSCDDCPEKQDDIYGRFCDLACGKWTAWKNHEAGADAMLWAIREELAKHYEKLTDIAYEAFSDLTAPK